MTTTLEHALDVPRYISTNPTKTHTIVITHEQATRHFGTTDQFNQGWYQHKRDGAPTLNVAIAEHLNTHRLPLLNPARLDLTNQSLYLWETVTGHAWYLTPGVAGSQILEAGLKKLRPRGATFKPNDPGPGNHENSTERPYSPRDWERTNDLPHAHGYDSSRMYLAAALMVDAAPWSLKHTGAMTFNPKLAGWWLIEIPAWNEPRLPDPAGYGPRIRWVTTPTATLLWQLAEQGLSGGFTVADSWTGTSRRLFRTWAETMNGGYLRAREFGADRLAAGFKAAARETLGLFNSPTYSTYRPDWWYTIIAQARCNLWRKMRLIADTEDRWPLSVATDNIRYGSSDADPVAACPEKLALGDRLGQFKIKPGTA